MDLRWVFLAAEDSKEQQRKEIMKLKRRFLKDRKMTSAFFAKTQTRQKIMREVNKCRLFSVGGHIHLSINRLGKSQAAKGSKEQQSRDVQEVQSRGTARYTDKVL